MRKTRKSLTADAYVDCRAGEQWRKISCQRDLRQRVKRGVKPCATSLVCMVKTFQITTFSNRRCRGFVIAGSLSCLVIAAGMIVLEVYVLRLLMYRRGGLCPRGAHVESISAKRALPMTIVRVLSSIVRSTTQRNQNNS